MPPSSGRPTRFIADAMLGSLARKLRALGFDTTYYRQGDDAGILQLAAAEQRIVLTADRSLVERARAAKILALPLTGNKDSRRVASLVEHARSSGLRLRRGESLCSICGGKLETLNREEVSGKVPPSVERRHRLFYRCVGCGRYYWKGSHWKKLRWLQRILEEIPVDSVS